MRDKETHKIAEDNLHKLNKMKNTFFNKTSELQLGDWVRLAYNKDKRCVKVICIYQNTIDTDYEGESLHGRYSDFEIEPIPITKEILENNGFTNWHNHSTTIRSCSMLIDKTYIIVQKNDGDNSIFIQFSRGYSFELRMDVKFVHELQHALRLFGLNELADNFKI